MRFASITFLACAVLMASPDIAMGASTGSKTNGLGSKGSAGKIKPAPAPAPATKPKKPVPPKKSSPVPPASKTKPAPPASKTKTASTASAITTSAAATATPTHKTHGQCPKNVLSCSTNAITNKADTCCYEQYGLHVLSQQWAVGLGPNDKFTIHGLWPNQCTGGVAPSTGCDSKRNVKKIQPIVQAAGSSLAKDMLTYWPSNKGSNDKFWVHEWNKHGTCATTLDPKCYASYKKNEDVVEYFNNAMKLHKNYDYVPALAKHSIKPDDSKTVTPADFKKAIKTERSVDVILRCLKDLKNPKKLVLSEVWTYFNVELTSTYTATVPLKGTDTCTGPFYFPEKNPAPPTTSSAPAPSST